MKTLKSKLAALLSIVTVAAIGSYLVIAQAAGAATLSLSSSTGTYTAGSNFTVTVKENSGSEAINTVQANLTYDASKLQFVSVDTSTSSFNYPLVANGGGGTVNIARGISGGATLTGDKVVAKVTFKALASSGSTAVTFAGDSAIIRPSDGQNIWNGATSGGTYSFNAPVAPAPTNGGSSGSSGGSTTGSPSTPSSGSTSNNTPPSTTNTTTTSGPTVAEQTASPETPVPVNNVGANADGYLVAVKIIDKSGKPVKNAEVKLGDKTAKSDETGVASFSGISAGTHTVSVKSSNGSVKGTVDVKNNVAASDVQVYSLTIKPRNLAPYYMGGGFIAALLLVLVALGLYKKGVFSNLQLPFNKNAQVAVPGGYVGGSMPASYEAGPTNDSTLDTLNKIHTASPPPPETLIHPNNPQDDNR